MIDILYTAWNRREFVGESLMWLRENTALDLVRRLYVIDDGSSDGTRELLDELLPAFDCDVILRAEQGIGPVRAIMRYLADDPLPVFAKIDSDCCVPPGWLEAMLDVLEQHPHVELLGMEAGMTRVAGRDGQPFDGVYGFTPDRNIGGIGLFRTSAFTSRQPMRPDGRNGFSEFQHSTNVVRGWITPDLACPLLNRLPFEPWRSLSQEYVAMGWQRPCGLYGEWMEWSWEWLAEREAAA